MVKTKPIDQVVQKWTDAAGRVPTAYTQGVQGADWQSAATAGQGLYVARMQDPSVLARRNSGISKVSDATWRSNAVSKGAARIAQGMAASKDKFQTGMAKNLATISGVTLAARTTDPMSNIDGRVKPIAKALHDQKMMGG
jgi:hypothetical protein